MFDTPRDFTEIAAREKVFVLTIPSCSRQAEGDSRIRFRARFDVCTRRSHRFVRRTLRKKRIPLVEMGSPLRSAASPKKENRTLKGGWNTRDELTCRSSFSFLFYYFYSFSYACRNDTEGGNWTRVLDAGNVIPASLFKRVSRTWPFPVAFRRGTECCDGQLPLATPRRSSPRPLASLLLEEALSSLEPGSLAPSRVHPSWTMPV